MKQSLFLFILCVVLVPFLLGVSPFVRHDGEPQVQGPLSVYNGFNLKTGTCTLTEDLIVDGGEIGVTGDLDLLQLSADSLTFNGVSTWYATATLATGGEAAPDVDAGGVCLQQNALDANIMTFKSSDVNHGVTTIEQTDTYGSFQKAHADDGGLQIRGLGDDEFGLVLVGAITTEWTGVNGPVVFDGSVADGTGLKDVQDGKSLFVFRNNTTQKAMFYGNGDFKTAGDIRIDGGLVGLTADMDLISMAANALTINGTISATSVTASTGDVTATAGDVIAGNDLIGRFAAYDFIPIEWCHDGAVAPDPAGEVDSGNGTVMAREFGGAAGANVHDVVCPWEVPDDIVAASGIKFKVSAVVTDAAGPTNQGLSFKLSGYSIGDNDPIGAAFGAEIEVTKTALTAAQFDRLQTSYSTAVTVTALAAGELAMLHFERDTAAVADDYLKPVGVTGIVVKYERLTAGF